MSDLSKLVSILEKGLTLTVKIEGIADLQKLLALAGTLEVETSTSVSKAEIDVDSYVMTAAEEADENRRLAISQLSDYADKMVEDDSITNPQETEEEVVVISNDDIASKDEVEQTFSEALAMCEQVSTVVLSDENTSVEVPVVRIPEVSVSADQLENDEASDDESFAKALISSLSEKEVEEKAPAPVKTKKPGADDDEKLQKKLDTIEKRLKSLHAASVPVPLTLMTEPSNLEEATKVSNDLTALYLKSMKK